MWRITVRARGRNEWLAIWSAAGDGAESDAHAQFSRVCRRIDGVPSEPENVHAEAWIEARLDGPTGAPVEYSRDTARVSTKPPMA